MLSIPGMKENPQFVEEKKNIVQGRACPACFRVAQPSSPKSLVPVLYFGTGNKS